MMVVGNCHLYYRYSVYHHNNALAGAEEVRTGGDSHFFVCEYVRSSFIVERQAAVQWVRTREGGP